MLKKGKNKPPRDRTVRGGTSNPWSLKGSLPRAGPEHAQRRLLAEILARNAQDVPFFGGKAAG